MTGCMQSAPSSAERVISMPNTHEVPTIGAPPGYGLPKDENLEMADKQEWHWN